MDTLFSSFFLVSLRDCCDCCDCFVGLFHYEGVIIHFFFPISHRDYALLSDHDCIIVTHLFHPSRRVVIRTNKQTNKKRRKPAPLLTHPTQSLGTSGLKTSRIILGAMSFGSPEWQPWVLPEDLALPLLKHAYDRGINTWDTADVYSNGLSEILIARAIQKYRLPRSSLVLMTKVYFGVGDGGAQPGIASMGVNDGEMVNRVGLSRKHVFDAVEASVGRLGTFIDVLQVHRLDRGVPREEVMRALNDVVERGWVRYLGASSVSFFFLSVSFLSLGSGWRGAGQLDGWMNE